MSIENIGTIGTAAVAGSLLGIIMGYAVKKVLKLGLIILGCFFGGIAYLQSQGLLNINWEKIEVVSNQAAATLGSAISGQAADSIIATLGLPLAGSMTVGFVIGFMRG